MKSRKGEVLKDAVPILEQFAPEPGYAVDHLLCLSYSLNPSVASALMVLCLPDIGKEFSEIDPSRLKKDEIGRAVRDIIPRSIFVIDGHDSIHGVNKMREFEHLIMHQVEKTGARLNRASETRGSFHPKLLLALYRPRWNEHLPLYGKCYIGSRNFTLDLAQEFGTVLPLVVGSPHNHFASGLSAFLKQAVVGEVRKPSNVTKIRQIALLVGKLGLGPPRIPGVEDMKFHWQDRRNPTTCLWPSLYQHFKQAKSIGIVSPWLSQQQCKHLQELKECNDFKVRCLDTETTALNGFATDTPLRLELANGSEYSVYDLGADDNNRETEPPLHMKYYFANSSGKQILFFGSANFTTSGLGPSKLLNTEILVQYNLNSVPYTLSGSPYEAETQPCEKPDPEEQRHQEWLDALELTWSEFRNVIKVDHPLFALQENHWHQLTLEGFTTNPQKMSDASEGGEDNHHQAKDHDNEPGKNETAIWSDKFFFGTYKAGEKGFPLELNTEVPERVQDADLSPLVRITLRWKRNHSVSTTKVVPIPEEILNAIRKSRQLPLSLKMSTTDYLEALAEITDGVSGNAGGKYGNGTSKTRLEGIIASFSLDQFAYRMAVLRGSEPARFRSGFERTREILSDLDRLEDKKAVGNKLLKEFKDALRLVLTQLEWTPA